MAETQGISSLEVITGRPGYRGKPPSIDLKVKLWPVLPEGYVSREVASDMRHRNPRQLSSS